ncbi:MAG: hypothetical protein JOZ42_10410 [Acetobacteraceae bacterium]|nr:hypothetical protein [Acetobacteraceae bacterium]
MTELKVSGHLMSLDAGLFCIVQSKGAEVREELSGLPGVRISLPPGVQDGIAISSFRPDGWLAGQTEAALVRVTKGPAQVLVTVYQSPAQSGGAAPKLQVLRLGADDAVGADPHASAPPPPPVQPQALPPPDPEVIAHVQGEGDVGVPLGQWVGVRGSGRAIEGFRVLPQPPFMPPEIEYQAILGRDWNSPWVSGGAFCGSRGMALPLLGLRVRLGGRATSLTRCHYFASFVDGSSAGPVAAGEACRSPSLAALEAFRILLEPSATAQ